MKINCYDYQGTKYYIRQNNYFGRVYVSIGPSIQIQASGDFKKEITRILGHTERKINVSAMFFWTDISESDVARAINTVYELGSPEDKQLGMPVGGSALLKKIKELGFGLPKQILRVVG